MVQIPDDIMAEVIRQQKEDLHWPEFVPAMAELPDPATGTVLWHRYQDLTVALCEQLVAYNSERVQVIRRSRPSRKKVKRIAWHILLARVYRCRYISLIGKDDSTEDDMPFAHNQW